MTHHWIITLESDGHKATRSGVRTTTPGETREDAFHAILGEAIEQTGYDIVAVLYFSLEPDQLGGPA